jgi:hypothetical protein
MIGVHRGPAERVDAFREALAVGKPGDAVGGGLEGGEALAFGAERCLLLEVGVAPVAEQDQRDVQD